MIRIAELSDLPRLALLLRELYREITPDHASEDLHDYRQVIMEHLLDDRDYIYVADGGFFIVRDETEIIAPTLHRFNGLKVYIEPEHRHSSLLANFYKRLFEDFPDGDILGMTEIDSEHIKVLDKRHTLIAKVYKLERS